MEKQRIAWLDAAKAISIIAMVIGHVAPLGSALRTLIFSFHMPLFFMATGFTQKPVTDYLRLWNQIKKDVRRILLPCIGAQGISLGLSLMYYGTESLTGSILNTLEQLVWGAAVEINGHPALGALWFLIALFWAKTVYGVVQVLFQPKNEFIIPLFAALCAWVLAEEKIWLPQSLDVVPMAVFFLAVGNLIRKYWTHYEKYKHRIIPCLFLFWTACVAQGINIEMGTRYYPWFWLCIAEAVAGSLCVFDLAEVLCTHSIINRIVSFIGKHTLLLLCIHHLDWSLAFLWSERSELQTMGLRLITDMGLMILVVGVMSLLSNKIRIKEE